MSIPLVYQEDVAETITVTRTQRIHILYNEMVSYFCHLSKNLWNQAHHLIYGYYKKYGHVPSYEDLDSILNKKNYYKDDKGKYNPDFDNYHKLGGATAQQILKVYIKAWISYLKGKKDYFDNGDNKDYTGKPREPGYKKKDGEFILIFTNEQIKFIEKKDGSVYMTFPKKIDNKPSKLADLAILLGNVNAINGNMLSLDPYLLKRLMISKFDQVRIVPKGTGYTIEIVYDQEVLNNASEINNSNMLSYGLDEDIIMSIDLGVENLAAITDNTGNRPIIIKTERLKADNQWYNKRRSELSSIYDRNRGFGTGCYLKRDKKGNVQVYTDIEAAKAASDKHIRYLVNKTGKKMDILTENRNNSVMDYLHKVSRYLINRALDIKSKTIAFVRNPGWKQKVKMGRKNNQNFVQIPYKKLIDMTRYKAEEYGIDVIDDTEEYTSKCSFLDSESVEYHNVYMGKRIHRGLFEASKGFRINSDVNGSYNFLGKVAEKVLKTKTNFDYVYPKFSIDTIIEGVVAHGLVPERLSVSDLLN
jgi:putative transposase